MTRLIVAALIALVLPGVALSHDYRFSRPDVLDLSAPELLGDPKDSRAASRPLAPDTARKILAAANLNSDAPGQIPYTGEYDNRARERERLLISTEGTAVHRAQKQLSIKPKAGGQLTFRDWAQPDRAGSDGDSETFVYAGRIAASRYHRVEELFGHDSPGSFLINPTTGKMAFVHNGGDVVTVSPDGERILAFDPLNSPFLLVIAALDTRGPTIEMQCRMSGNGKVVSGTFKGWANENAFDVVFSLSSAGASNTDIPVRFERSGNGWHWSASVPALLEDIGGYGCW